jgi:dolichol-phosphate mannosyltransferase
MLRQVRARLDPEQRRFLKFCIVGASGVAVNLAFVWVGQQLASEADPRTRDTIASALGIAISVFGNFLLNNLWTWGDRPKGSRKRDFVARIGRYYLASAAAIAIQFITAQALMFGLDLNIYVAQSAGILLGTVVNYIANNVWTFKEDGEGQDPESLDVPGVSGEQTGTPRREPWAEDDSPE